MQIKVTPIVPKVVEYEVKIVLSEEEFQIIKGEYCREEARKVGTLEAFIYPFPVHINRLLKGIIGR